MSGEFISNSKEELQLGADKMIGLAHFLSTHNQSDEAIVFINGVRYISKVVSTLGQVEPILEILINGFTEEGPNIPYLTRELSKLPIPEETYSNYTPSELGPKPWPDNPHYICDRGGKVLENIGDKILEDILYTAKVCHSYHTGYQKEKEDFSILDKYRDVVWNALLNIDEKPTSWIDTLYGCEQEWHEVFKRDFPEYEYESEVHTEHLVYGASHIIYYLQCLSNGTKIETSKHDKWISKFKELYKEITKRYLDEYNINVTPQDLIDIALKRRVVTDEGLIDLVPPRPDSG